MARDPETRARSRRVDRQRKRMRRAIPKLTKMLSTTTDPFKRRAIQAEIDRNKRVLETQLVYNSKTKKYAVSDKELERIEKRNPAFSQRSTTFSLREELRKAGRGEESAIADRTYSKLTKTFFMTVTQSKWEQHPDMDRLDALELHAKRSGYKSLEEFYDAFMADPAVRAMYDRYIAEHSSGAHVRDTDDLGNAYEAAIEPVDGTPIYLTYAMKIVETMLYA